MNRNWLWLCSVLIGSLAGCGDNSNATIDSQPLPDTPPPIDADMTPDTEPVVVRSGTISIQEIRLNGTTDFQGLNISVGFSAPTAPALGDGSIGTCSTWTYDTNNPPPTGLNEGIVDFTLSAGPAIPTCAFVGISYLCISESGAAAGGDAFSFEPAGAGTMTGGLTVAAAGFSGADVGRYISIAGATSAGNNGNFPVVGAAAGPTTIYGNPGAVAEAAVAGTTTYTVLAGAGPIPSNTDPGLIADDATVDVAFTAGGDNHFAGFSIAAMQVGNDFDLDTASAGLLSATPTPATAADMTIACDTGNCAAEGLSGALLLVESTNGDITGLPGTSFPAGSESVVTRCSGLGVTTITALAAHMQFHSDFFNGGGGTRIRTTFISTVLAPRGAFPAEVNVLAGHAVVGFTTP